MSPSYKSTVDDAIGIKKLNKKLRLAAERLIFCETCKCHIKSGVLMVATGNGFNCATCSYKLESDYWHRKYEGLLNKS